MFLKYELLYLLKILDYYESGLVSIIKYYINTYTFNINNGKFKNIVILWCKEKEHVNNNNSYGYISYWDVSKITDMSRLFKHKYEFNDDISRWNVSNVTNMEYMFYEASKFNQPLNSWDVSNVTNITYMFYYARIFNQPLDSWNISKVTNMYNLFNCVYITNQRPTIKHFINYYINNPNTNLQNIIN